MASETLAQTVPVPPRRTLANHTRTLNEVGQWTVAGGHIGRLVARSDNLSSRMAVWLAKH
jgi:hypothetical protein